MTAHTAGHTRTYVYDTRICPAHTGGAYTCVIREIKGEKREKKMRSLHSFPSFRRAETSGEGQFDLALHRTPWNFCFADLLNRRNQNKEINL